MQEEQTMKTWLITGGAGFIGSNFILQCRLNGIAAVVNFDSLTYAGNLRNLSGLEADSGYRFVRGDICDREQVAEALRRYEPDAIVHFAAESHVDRSIVGPEAFVRTNVTGTFQLLEATRKYWEEQSAERKKSFRLLHVSTDEVYGSLEPNDPPFEESTPYSPNSPYAASKAAADHLVRAYHHTYGFPALVTNCSNNYGPYQFPEKLMPLMILNAMEGKTLPVYGDGLNIRDWLYVADHCDALMQVLEKGTIGETYNIGGNNERSNLEVVERVCELLDRLRPDSMHSPHRKLVRFVRDRPGHDRRYAINCGKIERELGWRPSESFDSGLGKTIRWYIKNQDWVRSVQSGEYRRWIEANYAQR